MTGEVGVKFRVDVVWGACAEIKLRAERRAGELLAETPKDKGGRPSETGDIVSPVSTSRLSDLGVSKKQSSRWQKLFAVPEDTFDAHVEQVKGAGGELTTAGVLRTGKHHDRDKKRAANRKLVKRAPRLAALDERFGAIVLDPPWDWGDEGDADQMGRARPTYATMPFDEIAAQPIEALAQDNAHLYLWITNRSLPKGFALCAEIKLRAERRAGELLAETPKHPGGNPGTTTTVVEVPPKIRDLGAGMTLTCSHSVHTRLGSPAMAGCFGRAQGSVPDGQAPVDPPFTPHQRSMK